MDNLGEINLEKNIFRDKSLNRGQETIYKDGPYFCESGLNVRIKSMFWQSSGLWDIFNGVGAMEENEND